MTTTSLASMIVEAIELRARPSAHCPRCGSFAHWVNDPRAMEEAVS